MKPHLLLVEDDENLNMMIKDFLESLDYDVISCFDGQEGLEAFNNGKFDLVISDIMMPKKDGIALAKEIREKDTQTPFIFLTALGNTQNKILGFKSGCDDYIVKPFDMEEFGYRVEAVLKRTMDEEPASKFVFKDIYEIGKYVFNTLENELSVEGKKTVLTKKESNLLAVLCENKNQLVSKDVLLQEVWGNVDYFVGRSMDVYIAKLRKFLKNDSHLSIINVHGRGFRLEDGTQHHDD